MGAGVGGAEGLGAGWPQADLRDRGGSCRGQCCASFSQRAFVSPLVTGWFSTHWAVTFLQYTLANIFSDPLFFFFLN